MTMSWHSTVERWRRQDEGEGAKKNGSGPQPVNHAVESSFVLLALTNARTADGSIQNGLSAEN